MLRRARPSGTTGNTCSRVCDCVAGVPVFEPLRAPPVVPERIPSRPSRPHEPRMIPPDTWNLGQSPILGTITREPDSGFDDLTRAQALSEV